MNTPVTFQDTSLRKLKSTVAMFDVESSEQALGGSEPMYEEVANARKDLPQQKGLAKHLWWGTAGRTWGAPRARAGGGGFCCAARESR